jgi:Phosphotransferase enzyme family
MKDSGDPALRRIAAELELRALEPLSGGGTPARLWLAETERGETLVIKLLDEGPDRVDGHDLNSFRRKPRQIEKIRNEAPELRRHYPRILAEWDEQGWAGYATPFCEGRRVTKPLDGARPDSARFRQELQTILYVLTERGYGLASAPAPPNHVHTYHVSRLRRRLPLLRRYLDPALFAREGFVVNGRRCPSLPQLVERLARRHDLLAELQPPRMWYPVHGDLNLSNLVICPERHEASASSALDFVVLDPRGILEWWDPIYDLAKVLLSLSAWELGLERGFAIRRSRTRSDGVRFDICLRDSRAPTYLAAGEGLIDLAAGLPFFAELARSDRHWRKRLLLAHAAHSLAEAACRLSDRKPRSFETAPGRAAWVELATGFALLGAGLLNDLAAAEVGQDVDPRRHLAWLALAAQGSAVAAQESR